MKARLAAGVVPDGRDYTPRVIEGLDRYSEALRLARKRVPLPNATPSFFHSGEPLIVVALRPFVLEQQGDIAIGLADALSAVHQVPFRVRVLRPVGFYHGGPIGVWDISLVGVTFANPVTLHAITARGETTGLTISSIRAQIGEQPCTGRVMSLVAKRANSRWPAATIGWTGKPAASTPAITTRQAGGQDKHERLTVESVDLNGDRIADFVAWTGLRPAILEEGSFRWKAVFANVEGKWVLVAFAQDEECT
jgi:hypothetical protein